jgi:hypothetical protein
MQSESVLALFEAFSAVFDPHHTPTSPYARGWHTHVGTLFHTRKSEFQNFCPQTPHPHKNYKNFQGTMSNVGHYNIKKCPEPFDPGQKMATETIKEKQ